MADDFGTMVATIATDLNRGSSAHQPRIRKAVCDAIKFYKATRLGWNQKRAEAAISPDDEFVALPTDWLEVDGLRIDDATGAGNELSEVGWAEIDQRKTSTSIRGRPTKYAIQNRELRLWPPADQSYSLAMSFLYELKEVSVSATDGATNAWMSEGEELVRKHAMADLLVTYIGGQDAAGQALLIKADVSEVLSRLESQAAREQSAGKIRPYL